MISKDVLKDKIAEDDDVKEKEALRKAYEKGDNFLLLCEPPSILKEATVETTICEKKWKN